MKRRSSACRLTAAGVAWLALVAIHAAPALAHAQLLDTVPARDAVVATQPAQVIFEFNQPVTGTLGAVRVYDSAGNEVDDGQVIHPGGRQAWMGVGLEPHLPAGTYIATYRVVSADTHVVYGGNVFSIGRYGAGPAVTVAQLISRNSAGPVTKVAFAAVKVLDYASIALLIGVLAFLVAVWGPALAAFAGGDDRGGGDGAARAFEGRVWWLLLAAALTGVAVGALGILLQGATEAGRSLWSAADRHVISAVLHTRFGWVWGTRALVWLALAVGLLALALAGSRRLRPWLLAVGGLAVAYIAITPALSGHASTESPRGLLSVLDVVHVTAMGVWVGGLAPAC